MTYLKVITDSYTSYAHYLWNEITNPSWHNYFYWLIALSIAAMTLEWLFPWRTQQAKIRKDFWLDAFYMFFNFFLFSLIAYNAISDVFVKLFNDLLKGIGIENLVAIEISKWPFWTQLALMFVLRDFIQWNVHRMLHYFPFLWQFHKVHHSAEVLTPMTVYRMHPIDDIFAIAVTSVFTGLADGTFRFFFTPQITTIMVYNVNIFIFVFYIFAYHIRHSHIWFSYGPYLSYILISPAQHQIHHSKSSRHWDKNYGFIFSFWDWMFQSLYVPRGRETIEFGIGNGEEREFSSVLRLYFVPFMKAWRILRGKDS